MRDGPDQRKTTTTSASGAYTLSGLQAATFRLRASKDGYNDNDQTVNLPATTSMNFALQRSASQHRPPPRHRRRHPRLDTLFLTLPVSWRGTIAQYSGRLHRLFDGKREVRVYDYADLNVPMLARMFDRRCRGYEAVGYTILLPASAIPGWPIDVVLPSDPVWKRDYSGNVRRLVRDGVDTPLASLFIHTARVGLQTPKAQPGLGVATEAFLYRRLETLAETKGRFGVNVALPIAFDGVSTLEVDLLCADCRVAVELDGAQHLGDPIAYRRDRRKDQLLQENDYLVLRFLAEDVGTDLDLVLDAILRSLSKHREVLSTVHTLTLSRGSAR